MHLSFFRDDFRDFVETLMTAVRQIDKAESPIRHIHPVMVREGDLNKSCREDLGLADDDLIDPASELTCPPVLAEVRDKN